MAVIYISSTYEDLRDERQAAARAVQSLGHKTIAMEDYVASGKPPLEQCLDDIKRCDAYVGIFAWRYGFIPDGKDKSITHLEYEAAQEAGIPCLIFLLDSEAKWPVGHVAEGEERKKIKALREELKKKYIVSFFTDDRQLEGLVSEAVSRRFPFKPKIKKKDKSKKPEGSPKKNRQKWILAAASIIILIFLAFVFKGQIKDLLILPEMPEKVRLVKSKGIKVNKNKNGYWEADYGEGIIMVYIPEGTFKMGSSDYDDEKPPHDVYLDGYWMGKTEVTMGQYKRFISETDHISLPSWASKYSPGDNHPVVGVSWDDAVAYCKWLSNKKEAKFKLPTEAQWEKAARGTDSFKYPWGNHEPFYNGKWYANYAAHDNWDKRGADGFEYNAPVGSYPAGASPYGLLDMAGNAWEWCDDWYKSDYYKEKDSQKKNPTGPNNGPYRVIRGGGWYYYARSLRCSNRYYDMPSKRGNDVGFRLSQDN